MKYHIVVCSFGVVLTGFGCGSGNTSENKSLNPSYNPNAHLSIDVPVPEAMSYKITELITHATEGRYRLSKFELELRREFGIIYERKHIHNPSDRSLFEAYGWKGEDIYEYALDADMICYVFVRNNIVVGGF